MNTDLLKKKILDLAVRGKLVEQRPEEGTAEDLYQQIQEEKQKLIKEGKLKREKPLAPIADEEIPFDIPDSWRWVRIGDLYKHNTGKALNSANIEGKKLSYITTSNLYWNRFELNNLKNMFFKDSEIEKCSVQKGDLLVCEGGDIGRAAIWNFDYQVCIQNHIHKLRCYIQLSTLFYYYIFLYYKLNDSISGRGIGIQGLSSNILHNLVVPLPTLAEQKRIVEKIDLLFSRLHTVEDGLVEIDKLSALTKKKILDLAIRGELVEQRPEEGTAEDLYQKIQEEKQNLIKEGKLKKEKPLAPIEDDEIPFEIPEHWKWARLSSLVSVLGDGLHGTPSYDVNGTVYFINGNNLKNGKIVINDLTKKVSKEEAKKYYKDLNQSSLLVSINGTLGNVSFYDNEPVILGKSACYFNLIGHLDKYFFKVLIDSDYFQSYLTNFATGTTIKNVPLSAMRSVLIPLPPLAEQKRIVAKVEELLALCDKLKLK